MAGCQDRRNTRSEPFAACTCPRPATRFWLWNTSVGPEIEGSPCGGCSGVGGGGEMKGCIADDRDVPCVI